MASFYHSELNDPFSPYPPRASKALVWGFHGNYIINLHWELDDYFSDYSESVFSSLNSWVTEEILLVLLVFSRVLQDLQRLLLVVQSFWNPNCCCFKSGSCVSCGGHTVAIGGTDTKEEGHDSGVDESTQAKENGAPSRSTSKGSKGSPRKRTSRSTDPSPMKGRSPQSTASTERKLPMNKIQVGTTASPNLKSVRSKIGSLDNATHRPGGGKVKIESKKIDFSKQAASRITAKNEAYTPGGGEKKIESQKLQWKAQSKVGSLDNKTHKAGGGDKKIETHKLDIKAKSKVGSKDNIKHKAGGGEVQIEVKKLDFKDKAASKVGSLNNVKHKAGGGEKKIFDDREYMRQMSSPAKTPSKTTSRATSRASSVEGRLSPGGVMEEEDQVVQVSTSQGVTPSEE